MSARLVGWEIYSSRKVYCVDCDCYPPAAKSILNDDEELELYQCDGCGRTLDCVEPLGMESMGG